MGKASGYAATPVAGDAEGSSPPSGARQRRHRRHDDFRVARRAGPLSGRAGEVAVLGSALFGSISGSAVANVAITGTVTIPLMKRIGYRPEVAAAVEAAASTGGLVAPPVMSVVASLMAEY